MMKTAGYLLLLFNLLQHHIDAFFVGTVTRRQWHFSPAPEIKKKAHNTHPPLSDVDEMCIENVAQLCTSSEDDDTLQPMQDECDLEEHEALINTIQDQRDYHAEHVENLDKILSKLKKLSP